MNPIPLNGATSDMPDDTATPLPSAATQPAGKRLDPGLKRNLLIIGAVVGLSFVGVEATTDLTDPTDLTIKQLLSELQQADAEAALAGAPTTNPTIKQLLSELQQADADAARRAGNPYMQPASSALADQPR
jgi:hypothetical protein